MRLTTQGQVTLFFGALTLLFALPILIDPAHRLVPLSSDTRLFLWTLEWHLRALTTHPLTVFEAPIFYPAHHALAFSENLLGLAPLTAPVLAASKNPVLALNVALLAATWLSALGAYALARRLGASTGGALLAGLVFAFGPPRFARSAQVFLFMTPGLPWTFAFLEDYRSRGRPRSLHLAILVFTWQCAASLHMGLFTAFAGAAWLLLRATRDRALPARIVRDLGLPGLAAGAALTVLAVPYLAVRNEQGLVRTLGAVADWDPNLASFLASPSLLHEALTAALSGLSGAHDAPRTYLFPGFVTVGLSLYALRRWPAADRDRFIDASPGWAWLGAGLVLSLGTTLPFYGWLYAVLPTLDMVRVPSRFFVIATLGLAILAAAGLDRIRSPAIRRALVVAALLEFAVDVRAVEYRVDVPEADRWLASESGPVVVAEVPTTGSERAARSSQLNSEYMLHAAAHGWPTIHGYSGLVPQKSEALFRLLEDFPSDESLANLESLGVTHVVVHRGLYRPGERPLLGRFDDPAFLDRLTLVHESGDDGVYRLPLSRARR